MNNKILVIGSANTDLVIHSNRIPKLGETLVGSNFQTNAGGKGLNQTVAIAKLGGAVSFLGSIGQDNYGDLLLNTLKEYHISFEGIRSESEPTGIAMITIVNGDNFIILNSGANNALTPAIIRHKKQLIAESAFCVLQLEIPLETVLEICEIAKQSDTKIILNPAPFRKLPDSVYPMVDYLIPNEHEAEELTGIRITDEMSAIETIRKIRTLGVKNVVITLGEKGCIYNVEDKIISCPAVTTTAVDTTSAGDCFIGALVTKISQNEPISEAISFASKAAALTVSREGAAKSIPFAHEV